MSAVFAIAFHLCWKLNKKTFLTTEALRAQRKEFLIKKYSDLRELCVSAVEHGLLLWLRPCGAMPFALSP
jgi:hypothetical protein